MTLHQIGTCMDEKEAARRLDISRVTLRRARGRGEISHFRFGSRVVYSEAHIMDFLSRKEHRGNGQPTAAAA